MNKKQKQSKNLDNPIQTETQNIKSKRTLMTFSTFIILILIIIIVIMGIYIYKQNQAINKAACVINPLTSNNSISNIKEKTENNIPEEENIIKNIVQENTETNTSKNLKILSEKQSETLAQKTLEEYLSNNLTAYENSNIGPMPNILVILGLETEENINNLCTNNYDSSSYIRSNTKYHDFKSALLEYISEEYFNKNFSQYTNINDNVAFCNCAGGVIPLEFYKINFKSQENNIYTFNVILKDLEIYNHAMNPNEAEYYTESDYLIKKEILFKQISDDKLVIHKF